MPVAHFSLENDDGVATPNRGGAVAVLLLRNGNAHWGQSFYGIIYLAPAKKCSILPQSERAPINLTTLGVKFNGQCIFYLSRFCFQIYFIYFLSCQRFYRKISILLILPLFDVIVMYFYDYLPITQ